MTLSEVDIGDLCEVDDGELPTAHSQTPQFTSDKKTNNVFILMGVLAAPTISNINLISGLYFKYKPGSWADPGFQKGGGTPKESGENSKLMIFMTHLINVRSHLSSCSSKEWLLAVL